MANVESVEVLKGPAAILYGMVEPGGMVNIITKQPLAKPYYALNQQFGSFNNYRTTVDSTGPVTKDDTLLYRLNMSYQNSDSFRQFAGKEDVFLAPVLKWNISSKTQATLDFEYNYQHVGLDVPFIPFVNGQLTHIPQSLNYGEYSPGVIQSFYGGFNWSHQFNDDWKLKQRFSVNQGNTDISAWIFPTSATNTQVARFRAGDVFQNNTYSSGIDLTGHFDTLMLKHTLLLGGDYYRLDQNFQENTNLDPINFLQYSYIDIVNPVHPGTPYTAPNMPYYSQSTLQDQFGAYIQDQIKLPYDFQVMGGIRYQNIHQNLSSQTLGFPLGTPTIYSTSAYSQDAVTPRVGLLWQAKDWLSLYTNYVESFGANTGIVFTGLNTPPKPVPPTSAIQYEGGIKTEFFDGRLRANWAYFDLTKTNIATADPAHQALGPYVIAAGAARSRGTEMDITGEILPGWNAILTYSYLDATIIKSFETASNGGGPAGSFGPAGSRLWGVSHNNASLWSTYELQQGELKGLKFGGGVTVRDGQTACCDTPSFNIPGYATLNLLTSYSLNVGKSKITAQMNVNNLLDKYYITGLYTSLPGNAAYADFGAPRNFMGSIGIQY